MLAQSYLSYLRLVSRRIIHQAGFERVLRRKTDLGYNLRQHPEVADFMAAGAWAVADRSLQRFLALCRPRLDDGRMGLFLGLGMLKGQYRGRELCAPLALIPVDVEDGDDGQPTLRLHTGETQLNHDLLAVLIQTTINRDAEADDIGALPPDVQYKLDQLDLLEDELIGGRLPLSDGPGLIVTLSYRLNSLLDYLGGAIPAEGFEPEQKLAPGEWRLYHEPVLFLHRIPGDLTTHQALEDIQAHAHTDSLLHRLMETVLRDAPLPEVAPEDLPNEKALEHALARLPISLSAQQREVLREVWHHRVFYVEGPPGTGKSHTIAALMALAGSLGHSVLLTSQKPAALHVVHDKLAQLLGPDPAVMLDPAHRRRTKQILQDRQEAMRRRDAAAELRSWETRREEAMKTLGTTEAETQQLETDLHRLTQHAYRYGHALQALLAERSALTEALARQALPEAADYSPGRALHAARIQHLYHRLAEQDREQRLPRTAILWRRKYERALRQAVNPPAGVHFRRGQRQFIPLLLRLNLAYHEAEQARQALAPIPALQALPATRREWQAAQPSLLFQRGNALTAAWRTTLLQQARAQNAVLEAYHKSLNYVGKTERIRELWSRFSLAELTSAQPLWMGELRHLNRLLPLAPDSFDFVIVDEASQVNIAEVAPALFRAKRIVVVGDEQQLHLDATGVNFSLSATFDGLCWQRSGMGRHLPFADAVAQRLTVGKASILRWLSPARTGIPRTRLEEHYRSWPQLARFTSQQFYEGSLRIMTDHPARNQPPAPFRLHTVGGQRKGGKVVAAEVKQALHLVREHMDRWARHPQDDFFRQFGILDVPSIGLLAFNRDQVDALEDELETWDPVLRQRHALRAGTVEDWQGDERDIMVLSLALDGQSRYATSFYDNPNRFNVATSRARRFTELVVGALPPAGSRPHRLLNHFGLSTTDGTVATAWRFDEADLQTELHRLVSRWLFTVYLPTRPGLHMYTRVLALDHYPLPFVLHDPATHRLAVLELDGFPAEPQTDAVAGALARHQVLQRAGWPLVHVAPWNWYQGLQPAADDHVAYIAETARLTRDLDAALGVAQVA